MSYQLWFDAGFESLVSIIPPGAVVAPNSTISEKARGKAPGLPTSAGWVGYDWIHRTASRDNIAAWRGTGAGLGLRTDHFPGIDIDVLDAGIADAIEQITRDVLGDAPCRTGRAPKRLLLYRADHAMSKRRIEWMMDGERQAVEVLGAGSQCVVEGIHATAGTPYTWAPLHPVLFGAAALTLVTPADVDRLFAAITEYLNVYGFEVGASVEGTLERQAVAQEQLHGDLEAVAQAVRSISNDFPDRESYIAIGTAIKAALPAFEDDAYDLFAGWAARWSLGINEAATIEADWRRIKPPFEIGAQYLYDLAAKHGDTSRTEAALTFEDAPLLPSNADQPEPTTEVGVVKFSDAWLAHRFIARHGHEMRFCPKFGGWMYWDGVRWTADELDLVGAWAARVGRDASEDAIGDTPSDSRAISRWCNSERAVKQMLAYASRHQTIVARVEDFDADPWLLNTPGGVVDLKHGTLAPHTTPIMVTKCTLVAPSAEVPVRWLAFLAEVTGGDAALEAYLQRLFGYALTGVTEEEMLAFFWGTGGNGKGTLLKTISKILGSYATTAAMETFTASEYDRHPTDLAALAGSRLVIAQETQEGRAWDEAKIKGLTGGDPITARFMRQDFFTYQPQFKLVFAGNHRPNLVSPDAAMLRRFHLVPFDQVPSIVDTHLKDRLIMEYTGILGWMIEGCRHWIREGLTPPAAVVESTQEYFRDADPLGRWVEERCELSLGATALTSDLFTDYRNWCVTEGEECGTLSTFARLLRKQRKRIRTWRHPESRCRGFAGIHLAPVALDPRAAMLMGEAHPPPVNATLH